MRTIGILLIAVLAVMLIISIFYFTCTPAGVAAWNNWWHDIQKVDDVTDYETIKKVEDTCRAMIASYESDKLTYEQYKGSENEQERIWGAQAKLRANKTAVEYNNYILKNTYVWKDNIPADIYMKLEIIK